MFQTTEFPDRIRELLDRNLQDVFIPIMSIRRRAARRPCKMRGASPGDPGPGEAIAYSGWDVIIVRDGRIIALYVFLDETSDSRRIAGGGRPISNKRIDEPPKLPVIAAGTP